MKTTIFAMLRGLFIGAVLGFLVNRILWGLEALFNWNMVCSIFCHPTRSVLFGALACGLLTLGHELNRLTSQGSSKENEDAEQG
ncbi:MAG TPA: hypothetical protein EYP85_00905 [Armatimonadetes bacterium]|nr:hypothetical protein [Armatimonadota bacterium]